MNTLENLKTFRIRSRTKKVMSLRLRAQVEDCRRSKKVTWSCKFWF